MKATIEVGEERLVSEVGTIIPHAVGFDDGIIIATYHEGADAPFSKDGASVSRDNGETWQEAQAVNRGSAIGKIGPARAIFLDQYLWRTGENVYTVLYSETRDSGESFERRINTFHLKGCVDREYRPRQKDDPDYFAEPDIPDRYQGITDEHGAFWGGHLFGHVVSLPDGALGVCAYCLMEGNMTRRKRKSSYVGERPDEANAPEAGDETLWSSIFFRSEDDGATWHQAGTIGKAVPGRPFDAGVLYSEGFTETDVVPTTDGRLYALMRHGSYMLMWWAFSNDGGRAWDRIICHTCAGVAPNLTRMGNGMVAGAWGRPGLTVGVSLDGTVQNWDVMSAVFDDRVQSQKYPWLVPIGDSELLLLYDKRKWDREKRKHYDHGIYARSIEVSC